MWSVLRLLFLILKELRQMALDLSALQDAVTAETAVDQSVITLLTQLATELQTANDANDQPAIDAIVQTMKSNAASLATAVSSNTTPAPAPAPADPTA